jgi:hypothetical protein
MADGRVVSALRTAMMHDIQYAERVIANWRRVSSNEVADGQVAMWELERAKKFAQLIAMQIETFDRPPRKRRKR